MPETRLNTPLRSLILLAAGFLACLGMVTLRILVTGRWGRGYLVWNLILGLVPVAVAGMALWVDRRTKKPRGTGYLVGFSFLWLLFFPNSSYIFTDFIHLIQKGLVSESPNARGMENMRVWLDVINGSLFAFVGHFMGMVSLYVMHLLWKKRFGWWPGWVLVVLACWAAGYGVFIGRFVRWNSWHLFTHPGDILSDLFTNLWAQDALIFSTGFTVFLTVSYFFVYVFKKHLFIPKEQP